MPSVRNPGFEFQICVIFTQPAELPQWGERLRGSNGRCFLALNVSGGQNHTLQDSNRGEASIYHGVSRTQ